jgi:hypothetical protein
MEQKNVSKRNNRISKNYRCNPLFVRFRSMEKILLLFYLFPFQGNFFALYILFYPENENEVK